MSAKKKAGPSVTESLHSILRAVELDPAKVSVVEFNLDSGSVRAINRDWRLVSRRFEVAQ